MYTLRIAQAQINPVVGDFEANLELIAHYTDQARRAGAQIVTFPELALCGYPPEDLLLKPRFLRDTARALEGAAELSRDITLVLGFAEAREGRVYNAAAVLHQGRLLAGYRKLELPNYGVFDERRYFSPGQGCLFLDLEGVRVMLSICEDIWLPGRMPEQCAQGYRAQVVLNISGSPFHAGKLQKRQDIVSHFATSTGAYVCYNNLVGGQDELVFDGGSLVVDPGGRVLARGRRFEQDLLLCDITLEPGAGLPLVGPPHQCLELSASPVQGAPPLPRRELPEMDTVAEVYRALVLGTRDYVRKNGFEKVVLGLSGGIDSSLTAVVASEALGVENVVGVTMPSQYTSRETRSDAEALAANLGLELITVPIKRILDAYLEEMGPCLGPGPLGVTAENLQARIRGNILMGLSNRFGWLVLTTGNKSETAVGYCTLYGDMAGGFAVIKDVPKTLVYRLSTHANDRAGREVIPQSVIERPPTAELRPDQKDEDSLPPYPVLDPILKAYVEQDLVADQIVEMGFDRQVVAQVVRLVDLNEYKRRQAPPGVKITPKAFGKDRRLPITNHYHPGWP